MIPQQFGSWRDEFLAYSGELLESTYGDHDEKWCEHLIGALVSNGIQLAYADGSRRRSEYLAKDLYDALGPVLYSMKPQMYVANIESAEQDRAFRDTKPIEELFGMQGGDSSDEG